MEYLIVGDLHLHNHNLFGELNKFGINQRLMDGLKSVREALKLAVKKNIKVVFFLGDMFENKKNIPTDVMALTLMTFREFKENGITTIFLTGNHDKYLSDDNVELHTIEAFRDSFDDSKVYINNPQSIVIDRPKVISIANTDFFLIPYMDHKDGMLNKIYDLIDRNNTGNKFKVLMLHEDIGGVKYDNGTISSSPVKYEHLDPDKFNLIFSGHIHKRTEYLNLIYVGSAYQKNFSEEDDEKSFCVLKIKDKSIGYKFHKTNGKCFKTIDKNYTLNRSDNAYYKINLKESEVHDWIKGVSNKWVEGKDFIIEEKGVSEDINQIDHEEDDHKFDIKQMSLEYVAANDPVYDNINLDKNILIEILSVIGAV